MLRVLKNKSIEKVFIILWRLWKEQLGEFFGKYKKIVFTVKRAGEDPGQVEDLCDVGDGRPRGDPGRQKLFVHEKIKLLFPVNTACTWGQIHHLQQPNWVDLRGADVRQSVKSWGTLRERQNIQIK